MECTKLYVSKQQQDAFSTVNEALEAAKSYSGKVEIHIAAGVYKERIVVKQNQISFIGEENQQTVLTFDDGAFDLLENGEKRGTFRTASVFIDGDDFYAKNITFKNEAGQGDLAGQALAVYADGDHLMFENCRMEGYQDTLFAAPLPRKEMQAGGFKGPKEFEPRKLGRHYYKDCFISGNVDFIFGGATAYFENCEIFMRNREGEIKGFATAPSTFEEVKYGFVFQNCRFTSDCPKESCYLGRPWRNYGKTMILNSYIGEHIKKEGWDDWNKKDAWDTMVFAEYGNYGEGASLERAPFATILSKEDADKITREEVLGW